MAHGKRIIVFSDTHGRERAMIDILEKEAYAYIFLGDGERELDRMRERYPDKRIYNVRGNCDFASSAPDIDLLSVDGVRIMFTHGHNHGVKYSTDRLFYLAKQNEISVMLFGHTHCRHLEYDEGVYIMNPGSAAAPRDFKKPSYGYIDITDKGVFCAHADL
ncbi:MAG: YfcE family phosphodiesterase [Oscillospiraceae bacterium]|nr:YfcE family phosphodiesterase [Oscillospiraceae bacterium]